MPSSIVTIAPAPRGAAEERKARAMKGMIAGVVIIAVGFALSVVLYVVFRAGGASLALSRFGDLLFGIRWLIFWLAIIVGLIVFFRSLVIYSQTRSVVSSGGALETTPLPMMQQHALEDPRFARTESEYQRLKKAMRDGEMTPEDFDSALSALSFEYGGRVWMIGANSGQWYASLGDSWVSATPPGRSS